MKESRVNVLSFSFVCGTIVQFGIALNFAHLNAAHDVKGRNGTLSECVVSSISFPTDFVLFFYFRYFVDQFKIYNFYLILTLFKMHLYNNGFLGRKSYNQAKCKFHFFRHWIKAKTQC